MEGLAKGGEDPRTGSQSAQVSNHVYLLWGLFSLLGQEVSCLHLPGL